MKDNAVSMELRLIPTDATAHFPDRERLFAINEEAFPEWERIPSDKLLSVMQEYGCTPWGIYADDKMVGFTSVMFSEVYQIAYIWFLAIAADSQSHGYGSETLRLLRDTYRDAQFIIDMEPIDPAADNYAQRLRRLHFYERSGFTRAFVGTSYFGLHFELMSSPAPIRLTDFKAMLAHMSGRPFCPRFYDLEK